MPERSIAGQGEALSLPPLQSARLLDQLRERIRLLHYSGRTEEVYVHWCRAYIRFHRLRHPKEMGRAEIEAFLTWLAGERRVAASTHRQALSALLFLYLKVLGVDLPWMREIGRPRTQRRLPVVLNKDELLAPACKGNTGCWRSCCTAPGCASPKGCNCASRMSTSSTGPSSCARAKAARTEW